MNLKLIKNAATYRVKLPARLLLEDHLAAHPFIDPTPSAQDSIGFVPTPSASEGEFVTPFIGGVAFSVRYDNKVVPGGVVLATVAKRADEIAQQQGYRVGKKQRREIKKVVISELRARALVQTKIVTCFYHPESETLVVPVSGQNLADQITKLLIRAVESIESRTIHIAELTQGLTARLAGVVAGTDDAFAPFELANSVWLIGVNGEKAAYQMGVTLEEANQGLQELLDAGFTVEAVALRRGDTEFKLTNRFKFRSVEFQDPAEVQEFENPGDAWRHEASVQLITFVDLVNTLCEVFGYKAPAPTDAVEDPLS